MNSTKKYALITGATSGIGLELAKLFAKDDYNLIIVARDPAELATTKQKLAKEGNEIITIEKDLFERENAFAVYDEVKERGITVDVLVNNAGQGVYGEFKDTDIRRELGIIDLNIAALVILTKCFVRDMVERKSGKILNLASIASKMPGPWQSVYHGTKAFVLSFSEAIRQETKDLGITVTALLPGVTDTDFFDKADMLGSKAAQDESKMSDPADVAKDGYDALMAGDDKVVSGLKNKIQMAMSNVTPDAKLAQRAENMQEPADKE